MNFIELRIGPLQWKIRSKELFVKYMQISLNIQCLLQREEFFLRCGSNMKMMYYKVPQVSCVMMQETVSSTWSHERDDFMYWCSWERAECVQVMKASKLGSQYILVQCWKNHCFSSNTQSNIQGAVILKHSLIMYCWHMASVTSKRLYNFTVGA